MIRKARIRDVQEISRLVNRFGQRGVMLSVSLNSLYERLRDFTVIEVRRKIVACGSLHVVWENLGEIRSVAISKRYQGKGYGRMLMERLLEDARELELAGVFLLTLEPDFFRKFGFEEVSKEKLPHKVWRDCLNCPKFPDQCDETAMLCRTGA